MEHKPKKKLGCWWFIIPPVILTMLFFVQLWAPSPKIRISKQTTYIESHLDSSGLPNYASYLHERMQSGVEPSENAAVLYWQAMWPGELGGNLAYQNLLCEELGMSVPNPQEAIVPVYGLAKADLANWVKANVLPPVEGVANGDWLGNGG